GADLVDGLAAGLRAHHPDQLLALAALGGLAGCGGGGEEAGGGLAGVQRQAGRGGGGPAEGVAGELAGLVGPRGRPGSATRKGAAGELPASDLLSAAARRMQGQETARRPVLARPGSLISPQRLRPAPVAPAGTGRGRRPRPTQRHTTRTSLEREGVHA